MRKFWLENSNGKLWDLTTDELDYKTGTFFANPDGLGIKTKISSYEVENTFFIESVTTQSQTISGDLYFVDYDHYQRFVAFIGNVNSDTPMKLYYSTNGKHFENVLNKDGEVTDQAMYHITVGANSYLIVDSSADKQEATLYSKVGDELVHEDVYYTGEKNYTFSNFLTIPPGISTFIVSALNSNFGKVTLSYSIQKELI